MPPTKRPSHATRTGDEVVEALESASAELRHASKRLRLSDEDPPNDRTSVNPEELFANGIPSTQFARHADFREEHDRDRDELSDVDSEVEEQKIEETTQKIRKERQRQKGNNNQFNQALEAGILEQVVCTNFMCHPKLTVPFGPNINFIIGHNGSGKSAVLTAITLCLGGKATSTNRGQSLKSFIKEGQESATLAVKIKNMGDAAFKSDLYGPSIIVERHFNIQGVSGFKIKSADGRVVSTKRAELDEITDYYALQLDNPVNVLTQDMARQFLNNSTGSDKYKFLVKGVLLEQLDQDYCLVADSLNGTDLQLESVQEDCKMLQENHLNAQKKLAQSRKQDSLVDKIHSYQWQGAWAQVQEQEEELEQLRTAAEEAEAKIQMRQQEASHVSVEFDRADQKAQESSHKIGELEPELEPLKNDERDARSKLKDYEDEMGNAQSEQRTIGSERDNHKKSLQRFQDQLRAEEKRLEEHGGGAASTKRDEIDKAEQKIKDTEAELDRMAEKYPELEKNKQQADVRVSQAQEQVDRQQESVQQADRRLRDLKQHRGSANSGIHPGVQQLLNNIQQDSRYTQKPIGPIFRHVRLLKPEWSLILEKTFGSTLDGFIVATKDDQTILSNTMRQLGCQKTVYVNKRKNFDQLYEPDDQLDTILRILEFDNEAVRNHLIINTSIEQVVLIQDQDQALKFMTDRQPRNTKACLYMQKGNLGWGARIAHGRGNSLRDDTLEPWNGNTRLRSDDEAQINIQSQIVSSMKQVLGDAQRHKDECVSEQTQCSQLIKRHQKEADRLRRHEISKLRDVIDEKRAELDQITPQDGRLESLKKEVEKAEEKLGHIETQLGESQAAMNEMHQAKAPLENDANEKAQMVHRKTQQLEQVRRDVKALNEKRGEILKEKNLALLKVKQSEEDAAKAQNEREEQKKTVEDFIKDATSICARVPVEPGLTGQKIDKILFKLHKELERFQEQIGGDNEQIHREACEAKEAHVRAEKHFENLKRLQTALIQGLQDRRSRWKRFRAAICTRARSQFVYLLSERGYRGRMLIDHISKELELQVEPDLNNKQSSRQTKTLSGGEKSFTTICMLLALWDAMGSPIRCLDEFDVFMDSVNRDISVRLLIESARMSVGRQFILITPQAMGTVQSGDDVKIIRLNDPERGQTALNIPGT